MNRKCLAEYEAGKAGPGGVDGHVTVLAGDIVETRKAFESFSVRRVDISRFASAGAGRKKSRDQVVCPVRFLQDSVSPDEKRRTIPLSCQTGRFFRYALLTPLPRTVQISPAGSLMSRKKTSPFASCNLPFRPTASVRIQTFRTIPETELSG